LRRKIFDDVVALVGVVDVVAQAVDNAAAFVAVDDVENVVAVVLPRLLLLL
jgi:hypothetical protein